MTPPWWWPRCHACGRWLSWEKDPWMWPWENDDWRDYCRHHVPDPLGTGTAA